MTQFTRAVIALDNSDFDTKILRYFYHFVSLFKIEKLYFVHVDQNLELPKGFDITYKDEHGKPIPKDELLRKLLKHKIEMVFGKPKDVHIEIDVREGSAMEQVLHWVQVKEANLLVLGNKVASDGSGVLARKVARNTNCAVLFVPETSKSNIHSIMVPIDFSEYSVKAMRGAIDLCSQLPNSSLTAFHAYDVPLQGYPTISMNYENFVRGIAAFKMDAFKEYIKQFDLKNIPIKDVYAENDPSNPARHIHRYAHNHQMDLIVMAAKGHNLFDRLLIGSVTEKLVTYDKEVPVLVLR